MMGGSWVELPKVSTYSPDLTHTGARLSRSAAQEILLHSHNAESSRGIEVDMTCEG